jgi:hypothetical protein
MNRRIDKTGLPAPFISKLWVAAGAAAAGGWGVKLMMGVNHPIGLAILSLGAYGSIYFLVTKAFRLPEATGLMNKVAGFAGFRRPGRSV